MDNKVIIVAIVAAAVVVVLYIFRDKLKSFSINASEKGIKAQLKTELPARAAAAGEFRGATVEDSKAGGNIRADATGGGATVRRSEAVGNITATSRQPGDPPHPKARPPRTPEEGVSLKVGSSTAMPEEAASFIANARAGGHVVLAGGDVQISEVAVPPSPTALHQLPAPPGDFTGRFSV